MVQQLAADRLPLGQDRRALAALGLLSDLAAQRPLLCLVDDAQWIDLESLQALAFVARRAEADSFALVFSTRVALDELAGIPRVVVQGLTESIGVARDQQFIVGQDK